jgi:hypothetical protein
VFKKGVAQSQRVSVKKGAAQSQPASSRNERHRASQRLQERNGTEPARVQCAYSCNLKSGLQSSGGFNNAPTFATSNRACRAAAVKKGVTHVSVKKGAAQSQRASKKGVAQSQRASVNKGVAQSPNARLLSPNARLRGRCCFDLLRPNARPRGRCCFDLMRPNARPNPRTTLPQLSISTTKTGRRQGCPGLE